MDLPDLTGYTDDDLRTLGDAVAAERSRRYVLAQAVTQGTALALEYAQAGGDVSAAWAEILANVQAATQPPPTDPPAGS